MSFTADEKLSIVEILEITPAQLEGQLTSLVAAGVLTTELLARVRTKLSEWSGGIGSNHVFIEPTESNFGARIGPGDAKQSVKTSIAIWLGLTDLVSNRSSYRIRRG